MFFLFFLFFFKFAVILTIITTEEKTEERSAQGKQGSNYRSSTSSTATIYNTNNKKNRKTKIKNGIPSRHPANDLNISHSREEMWITSVGCHYSNGVDGDQYDIIISDIAIIDIINNVPSKFFSTTRKTVVSTWGYTPTLNSILRQKDERFQFFKWMKIKIKENKQHIRNLQKRDSTQRYSTSQQQNPFTNQFTNACERNMKCWIEVEHYRTGKYKKRMEACIAKWSVHREWSTVDFNFYDSFLHQTCFHCHCLRIFSYLKIPKPPVFFFNVINIF